MTGAESPEALVLAAIERAVRHSRQDSQATAKRAILAHLDIRPRSRRSSEVGATLEALVSSGLLTSRRQHGRDLWALTSNGRRRLRSARAAHALPELPEAPQHRAWRERRALAEQKTERFRRELGDTLKEGRLVLLDSNAPASSAVWEALGKRLERCCANLASAVYCLREWDEPSDERSDRGHAGTWHLRDNVRR